MSCRNQRLLDNSCELFVTDRIFLTTEAVRDYLKDCRVSLWMGLIGPNEFLGRLVSLKMLSGANSPVGEYCSRTLGTEEVQVGESDEWPDRTKSEMEQSHEYGNTVTVVVEEDDIGDTHILQLIPAVNTGLSFWMFRKGDPDPLPSVPKRRRRGLLLPLGH